MTPSLSITVPVYNEEDNIDVLYQEIRDSADKLKIPYEIIFIDDGSTDATFDLLKNIKKKEQRGSASYVQTRIIRFRRNYGQTCAMQAGFDNARGDIIVSMDGDLQNDPRDIPKLLDKINEGFDVVCGWRKDRKDKKLTRIIPSKIANWLIGIITGVKIHDYGCSLKLYKAATIQKITFYSDMHRFIPAMATLVGARIAEIEVNHRHRKFGMSKYGLNRIWKVFLDICTIKMITGFASRPALLFGLMSLPFLSSGLIFFIVWTILYYYGFIENLIVIPSIIFLLFFMAIYLLTTGILGELCVKTGDFSPAKDIKTTVKTL